MHLARQGGNVTPGHPSSRLPPYAVRLRLRLARCRRSPLAHPHPQCCFNDLWFGSRPPRQDLALAGAAEIKGATAADNESKKFAAAQFLLRDVVPRALLELLASNLRAKLAQPRFDKVR